MSCWWRKGRIEENRRVIGVTEAEVSKIRQQLEASILANPSQSFEARLKLSILLNQKQRVLVDLAAAVEADEHHEQEPHEHALVALLAGLKPKGALGPGTGNELPTGQLNELDMLLRRMR